MKVYAMQNNIFSPIKGVVQSKQKVGCGSPTVNTENLGSQPFVTKYSQVTMFWPIISAYIGNDGHSHTILITGVVIFQY
jgi:hypothetical protein